MTRATQSRASTTQKKKKTTQQKTMKIHYLDSKGNRVKDKDGKTKMVEAVVYNINDPDCPKGLVNDIHAMFKDKNGSEIRSFLKGNKNYKKATRQVSLRQRGFVNYCLNFLSRWDDWMLCRPYGGGAVYLVCTRLGIPIVVTGLTRGRIPFLRA